MVVFVLGILPKGERSAHDDGEHMGQFGGLNKYLGIVSANFEVIYLCFCFGQRVR